MGLLEIYDDVADFTPEITKADGTTEKAKGDDGNLLIFRVAGMDSDRYNDIDRRRNQRMAMAMKKGRFKASDADEDKENYARDVAHLIVGWSSNLNAELGEYSAENALKMCKNPRLRWLVDQIDRFAGERANFSKN